MRDKQKNKPEQPFCPQKKGFFPKKTVFFQKKAVFPLVFLPVMGYRYQV